LSVAVVGSFTLLEINAATAASLTVFLPLLAQFDLNLGGLAAAQSDISLQFNAALAASVSLSLEASNPLAGFQASLQGLGQLQASLQLALSLGLPTVSAELNTGLSAQLAVTAALGARVGIVVGLIEASIAIKRAALNFVEELQASLGAGPVFLLRFDGNLATAGSDLGGVFGAGLLDPLNSNEIQPTDSVHGLVLVTRDPGAWVAMQTLFRTT
jgi:hypothetical protein